MQRSLLMRLAESWMKCGDEKQKLKRKEASH